MAGAYLQEEFRLNPIQGLRLAAPSPIDSDGNLSWFALQVRSRHETGVAEHLLSLGYEGFLPTYSHRKRWSDRVKEIRSPLFPGYMFCRFDPQFRLPILQTPGVIQVVGCKRQPVRIEESEIKSIQTLVSRGIPSQPWPFLLEVGERVRIDSGPLRGLEGIVLEFKGRRRLILSVTLLQRSVSVDMDAEFVKPDRTSLIRRVEGKCIQPLPLAVGAE